MAEPVDQVAYDRGPGVLNTRFVAWSAAGAIICVAAGLALGGTLPKVRPAVSLAFFGAATACAVLTYLVYVRAQALDDGRLRWVAGGYAVACVGLLLHTVSFLPGGGPMGTTESGSALLYVLWHLVVLAAVGAAASIPAWSPTRRLLVGGAATSALLFASSGSSSVLVMIDSDGRYTALFRACLIMLMALAALVTAMWVRRGTRSAWVEAWITVGLVLAGWDLLMNALAESRFSAFWWSSVTMRFGQFAIPAAGLLAGFVAVHRALDRHQRSLSERLEVERKRAEEEGEYRRVEERRRAEIVRRIDRVMSGDALRMVFQPIVSLSTGVTVGVEALARFSAEPYRPPDAWFEEAADVGVGLDLELMATRAALAELHVVPPDMFLALNVSPEAAASPALAKALTGPLAPRVVLEITEHARVVDYDALNGALRELRAMGVRLAVDDVGAGFASMRHIVRLSPDFLKLDVTLTRDVDSDPVRHALASSLITFARDIGAAIVAEGIETSREIEVLRRLDAAYGQGHYLAMPGPLPSPRTVPLRALRAV